MFFFLGTKKKNMLCRQGDRAETQLRNSGVHLLWVARSQGRILIPALCNAFWNQCLTKTLAPSLSFSLNTEALPDYSQPSPPQAPFVVQITANHCHDSVHQKDPGGFTAAGIHSLNLPTQVHCCVRGLETELLTSCVCANLGVSSV